MSETAAPPCDYTSLKVDDLKALLLARKLPVSGSKGFLIAKLIAHDEGKPIPKEKDFLGQKAVVDKEQQAHRLAQLQQADAARDEESLGKKRLVGDFKNFMGATNHELLAFVCDNTMPLLLWVKSESCTSTGSCDAHFASILIN